MPKISNARVSDYNPDLEIGDTLDAIEGQDVTIASVSFDPRQGKNGDYDLCIITLDDGRIFHTGSPIIAKRLEKVTNFPVLAKFQLVKSQSDSRKTYWHVS
jgi:hypothetical protein